MLNINMLVSEILNVTNLQINQPKKKKKSGYISALYLNKVGQVKC